ncbi:MAG: rod shape-determining protein, partial [Chitinispirillaceae bacterium]|nr:rod shape-determining protein [Chitinispirillaceae bacterium]
MCIRDRYISVPGVGGREQREVSKAILASIIEPRIEEIFTLALREIRRTEYSDLLGAGIVLTGGCALMEGIKELGERVFELPVKIGVPRGVGGLTEAISSPLYSTAVGLCLYALENEQKYKGKKKQSGKEFWSNLWKKIKEIIKDFF